MAALAKDTPRIHTITAPDRTQNYPLLADARIYQGSLVGLNTSAARALVAGDTFMGLCANDSADYAEGDRSVAVVTEGHMWVAAITNSTGLGDLGNSVYAASDNDFTEVSTDNSLIGKIVNYDADKGFLVHFKSALLT